MTIAYRFLPTAAAVVLALGCRAGGPAERVDAAAARETLKAALDSWKRGEKSDALQKATPAIYVIDQEWQEGAVLKDYRLVGDEEKDAHLYCRVALTVRAAGGGGAESTREVTFIVSTSPNRTVSRKVF